jgi:hypothetical protein
VSRLYGSKIRSEEGIERFKRASREAKQRRRGVCVEPGCENETRYSGHGEPGGVALRCSSCSAVRVGERLRGQGRLGRAIRDELLEGPERAGVLAYRLVTAGAAASTESVRVTLHRLVEYGLVKRTARGVYALADEREEV